MQKLKFPNQQAGETGVSVSGDREAGCYMPYMPGSSFLWHLRLLVNRERNGYRFWWNGTIGEYWDVILLASITGTRFWQSPTSLKSVVWPKLICQKDLLPSQYFQILSSVSSFFALPAVDSHHHSPEPAARALLGEITSVAFTAESALEFHPLVSWVFVTTCPEHGDVASGSGFISHFGTKRSSLRRLTPRSPYSASKSRTKPKRVKAKACDLQRRGIQVINSWSYFIKKEIQDNERLAGAQW